MPTGGTGDRERAVRDAVLRGDAAAWRAVYDDHYDRLARYVRWRCGNVADLADDALQETWLLAVRRLRRFDPDRGPLFAWLCGIAANAVRNAVRGRARQRRRVSPMPTDPPAAEPPDAVDGERVATALAALPDRYEAVLRAKYLDGRAVDAIAAEWGDTPKAVESLLSRARQAFREAYAADGNGE